MVEGEPSPQYGRIIRKCVVDFKAGEHEQAIGKLEETIETLKTDRNLTEDVRNKLYTITKRILDSMYIRAPELVEENPDIELIENSDIEFVEDDSVAELFG